MLEVYWGEGRTVDRLLREQVKDAAHPPIRAQYAVGNAAIEANLKELGYGW